MKFYDCATAPSPRRVRIFMAEKNIEIEKLKRKKKEKAEKKKEKKFLLLFFLLKTMKIKSEDNLLLITMN